LRTLAALGGIEHPQMKQNHLTPQFEILREVKSHLLIRFR
jgi:hypothetical protein